MNDNKDNQMTWLVEREKIDHAIRQVWLAYRDASDMNADMLTDQDMELWGIVTRHRSIQDRLSATLPKPQAQRTNNQNL